MKRKIAMVVALEPEIQKAAGLTGNFEKNLETIDHLGYDGVELFIKEPDKVDTDYIKKQTGKNNLSISGIGTGLVYKEHCLSFASSDLDVRSGAVEKIKQYIELAEQLKTFVIIGSVKGNYDKNYDQGWENIKVCLEECAEFANKKGVQLAVEPLNPPEKYNIINTMVETVKLLKQVGYSNVKVLADTYHMNMSEPSINKSFNSVKDCLGHVQFSDSNRLAPGLGELDFKGILNTLDNIGYDGWIGIEIKTEPDQIEAARQAINCIRSLELECNWDNLYKKITPENIGRLYKGKKAFVGLHCVIDGIHSPDKLPDFIQRVETYLNNHDGVRSAVKAHMSHFENGLPFNTIKTVDQFIAGFLYCAQYEHRLQLMIQDKKVFEEIKKELLPEEEIERQFCGSTGWQARMISIFADEVLTYVNHLTDSITGSIPERENLKTIDVDGNKITAYKAFSTPSEEDAVHYAVNFKEGQKILLPGLDFSYEITTSGLYIPSWNPLNSRLEINSKYRDYLIKESKAKDYTHFIFSGLHILSSEYDDGQTVFDRTRGLKEFIKDMRGVNPCLKIHVEFGSIKDPIVREAAYDLLKGESIGSLGINEIELSQVLVDLGYKRLAGKYEGGHDKALAFSPENALAGLYILLDNLKLKTIHLHHKDYQLVVNNEELTEQNLTSYRDALIFASTLCAKKIETDGDITGFKQAFESKTNPISSSGLEGLNLIAKTYYWEQKEHIDRFLGTGIFVYDSQRDPNLNDDTFDKGGVVDDMNVIYVPAKKVDHVRNATGNGEACISSFHLST